MYNRNLSFHFVGIGGSGMSGLAEILFRSGFKVTGSDVKETRAVKHLREIGVTVVLGHAADNLPADTSSLVYSSAISMANVEIAAAKERGIPVIRRAEVLAELMRLKFGIAVAGSHGKTTTTTFISLVLEAAKMDPTIIIGGRAQSIGSNAKLGSGEFLVAETDESDRSFLLLKPTIAVVTNIDHEHLESYASIDELEESFESFVKAVPFYGLNVLCIDNPKVRALADKIASRKVTFGLGPDCDYRATNIEVAANQTRFSVEYKNQKQFELSLPIAGRHMASNSLAAVAVGHELGISHETIAEGLAAFAGVDRRLEILYATEELAVVSDYGHHPTEIRATLAAVREGWGRIGRRIVVVFEPHRYTRTKSCFVEFLDCFGDADLLLMTEIYSAGESPIAGVSGEHLLEAIAHNNKHFIGNISEACESLNDYFQHGDLVLFLGAGSIGSFAHRFVSGLERSSQLAVGVVSATPL